MNRIIDGFISLLSFFTLIPIRKKYSLEEVASSFYLVPFIALITGGVFALALYFSSFVFNPFLYSILGILSLALVTRAQQIDALMDFCDGLLCFGNSEEKIKAMRDSTLGAGGIFGGFTILLLQIATISFIPKNLLVSSAFYFEIAGKYAMVLLSFIGNPLEDSSAASFCYSLRGVKGIFKMVFASLITFIMLSLFLNFFYALITILSTLIVSLIISFIANRSFGGINGDVVGGSNQIAGTVALILLLALIK